MSVADVVVIGGGPSGAVASALLASWGRDVILITQAIDSARGLVNSLPPSTRKILTRVGIIDIVERVGFPTTGNTVWWGDDERVESFGEGALPGYQVFRPALDPLLIDRAAKCGVRVIGDATVTRATVGAEGSTASYRAGGRESQVVTRLALDCSGRTGVIARQGWRRPADVQMQALLGTWTRAGGWPAADDAHTSVETYDDGWAWTVPISPTVRHTGVMIHGGRSRLARTATLADTYVRELSKSRHLGPQADGAELGDVWACDASLYSSTAFAGPGFLLIGDAGSTIDPLSSFGMKKALTSAWLGAVAANTRLEHPERAEHVDSFFSEWEGEVYATHLQRSRTFAAEACARHPSAFWASQAAMPVAGAVTPDDRELLRSPEVAAALATLKSLDKVRFTRNVSIGWKPAAIVRGEEIDVVDAVPIDGRRPIRFLSDVDLVELASLAPSVSRVPDLFEQYQRRHASITIVDVLGALAFLVARGVLHVDPC